MSKPYLLAKKALLSLFGKNFSMQDISWGHDKNTLKLRQEGCLLYTSDAADEGLGVDLGGRRIIKNYSCLFPLFNIKKTKTNF